MPVGGALPTVAELLVKGVSGARQQPRQRAVRSGSPASPPKKTASPRAASPPKKTASPRAASPKKAASPKHAKKPASPAHFRPTKAKPSAKPTNVRLSLKHIDPASAPRLEVKELPVAPSGDGRSELPTLSMYVFPQRKKSAASAAGPEPAGDMCRAVDDDVLEMSIEDYFADRDPTGGAEGSRRPEAEQQTDSDGDMAETVSPPSSEPDGLSGTHNELLATVARSDASGLAETLWQMLETDEPGEGGLRDTLRMPVQKLDDPTPDRTEDCTMMDVEGFRSSVRECIFGDAEMSETDDRVVAEALQIISAELKQAPPNPPPPPTRVLPAPAKTRPARPASVRAKLGRVGQRDVVKVTVDADELQRLSEGHGGWGGNGMAKCCGEFGVVVHTFRNGDVFVRFGVGGPAGRTPGTLWRMNPRALVKVDPSELRDQPKPRAGSPGRALSQRRSVSLQGSPARLPRRGPSSPRVCSPTSVPRTPQQSPARRHSSPPRTQIPSPPQSPPRRHSSPQRLSGGPQPRSAAAAAAPPPKAGTLPRRSVGSATQPASAVARRPSRELQQTGRSRSIDRCTPAGAGAAAARSPSGSHSRPGQPRSPVGARSPSAVTKTGSFGSAPRRPSDAARPGQPQAARPRGEPRDAQPPQASRQRGGSDPSVRRTASQFGPQTRSRSREGTVPRQALAAPGTKLSERQPRVGTGVAVDL